MTMSLNEKWTCKRNVVLHGFAKLTSKLYMNAIRRFHFQVFWSKVIFNSRINLNYITPLSFHVKVTDDTILETILSRYDFENMRTILESAAKLGCVDGKLKRNFVVAGFPNINVWVIGDNLITIKNYYKLGQIHFIQPQKNEIWSSFVWHCNEQWKCLVSPRDGFLTPSLLRTSSFVLTNRGKFSFEEKLKDIARIEFL